jgi:hypothetical protein
MDYTCKWVRLAPQLFWDRQIFAGSLSRSSSQADFEKLFIQEEVYKLMRCSRDQGLATAKAVFREYSTLRMPSRFEQIEELRPKRGVAA